VFLGFAYEAVRWLQTVVPDDWNDAPAGFTLTRECFGRCVKTYKKMTPAEMTELTNLPLSGWMAKWTKLLLSGSCRKAEAGPQHFWREQY
jgi:hypothetical protein